MKLLCLLVAFSFFPTAYAFIPDVLPQNQRSFSSDSLSAEATFGMVCFWKPSEDLLNVPGVTDTFAGYTGKANAESPPNYESVCFSYEWVEGVRVVYDETQLEYDALLDAFFEAQEPKLGSRQYSSVIFPHDDTQQRIAADWLERNCNRLRGDGVATSWTTVEPLANFYRAENYHQRYWQKTRPRVAGMIALLAIATGILDGWTPEAWQENVHTVANATVLAGLFYVLIERRIDTKVVQLS
jgi:peptide-methionine (S)-S-oxide reductase